GQRTRRTARQRDAEMSAIPAALATAWHHCDLPTVRLDELARNGNSQARALDPATSGGLATAAEEEIEDRLALFRRHAWSGVHHLDHRVAGRGAGAQGDGAARRRELHR